MIKLIERYGDLWDGDIVVITTNGFVKRDGCCVMGRGCAKEAKERYPHIDYLLGQSIKQLGNKVLYLGVQQDGKHLLSFPVKPVTIVNNGTNIVKHMTTKFKIGEVVPGWAAKADIQIIHKSVIELRHLVNKLGFKEVYMPRPGCGAGELKWKEVKPILAKYLDDRFVVCHK